jgi:hypothetical protein
MRKPPTPTPDPTPTMPWGQFKGQEFDTIPSAYLKKLAEDLDEDNDRERPVMYAADIEYNWRTRHDCHF